MFVIDLSHTSHTRARTGIQRVCRSLLRELSRKEEARPATWDPHADQWRPLRRWEEVLLGSRTPDARRSASWPLPSRLRGRAWRLLSRGAPAVAPGLCEGVSGLIVPELFSPATAAALPALIGAVHAPAVALFHDALALRLPEHSPAGTVTRMPAYLLELSLLDGVAAVSEDSRQTLLDYWAWAGLRSQPPVTAIPLGVDAPASTPKDATARWRRPTLLCLCSIEGRKNHLALLEACEKLWKEGVNFELRLAGLARKDTASAALERIGALQAAGRPLLYDGPISEQALEEAYAGCLFTVYPSLAEGFGLPVLESLVRGKPCICSNKGALGEVANRGGCLGLDECSPTQLAMAIRRLLTDTPLRERLETEARTRVGRSWADHAKELTEWIRSLPLREDRGRRSW
jgi:glycosyltransferase involved in cell wall biosynthesis